MKIIKGSIPPAVNDDSDGAPVRVVIVGVSFRAVLHLIVYFWLASALLFALVYLASDVLHSSP